MNISVFEEGLRKFCALEQLNLRENMLTALPADFWTLYPNIQSLDISHNALTELPSGVWPEKLHKLVVHHNYLSFVQAHSSLVVDGVLDLSYNQISSFPEGLDNVSDITEVSISFNRFKQVPQELQSCSSLERLFLQGNEITELPSFIGLFPLKELKAQKNHITRIPQELYRLIERPIFSKGNFVEQKGFVWPYRAKQQIHQVRMKKFFERATPQECKGMYKLDLSGLGWTEIPSLLFQLSTLHHLNLSGNQLTKIPEEIANLENLITLNLRDNRIQSIPSSLEKLKKLKKLFLSDNQIQTFPSFLRFCPRLEQLNLSGNLLSEIPESIWSFPKLSICVLKTNQISVFPSPKEPVSKQWSNINLKGNPFFEDFGLPFIRVSKEKI